MVSIDRSQVPLRVILGCCCLFVCLGGVSLGAPACETTIAEQTPSEQAMAASLDVYSPGEIEPIAFAMLSSDEQTAVAGAIDSPARVYTDREQSGDGSQFAYRNDVINQYFVSHGESIYLAQVVVDIGYLSLLGGLLIGMVGVLLVASGLWARRSGPSLRSDSLSEAD
jgi:hypothetical protein